MTVAEAVISRLSAISAVTALVGTRIYNVKLRQGSTLPAIRVQDISGVEDMHLRGGSGVRKSRVQIDSVSSEQSAPDGDPVAVATAVDEALYGDCDGTALLGWKGEIGSPAFEVLAVRPASRREGYDAEELRQFKVIRDVFVEWRQQ